jgi:uncharacterized protein YacL
MVLHLVRILFVLAVVATTVLFVLGPEQQTFIKPDTSYGWIAYMVFPAISAFALVLVDMLWRDKKLRGISGLFFGLLAGVVLAYTVNLVLGMLFQIVPGMRETAVTRLATALVDAAIVFLAVTIVLQTRDDFRFIIPYVEFSRQSKGPRPLLLDTSVIIDGRVADVAETGFLDREILVPRFILEELQAIADSADKLRRNRGRRGLDVLRRLQSSSKVDIRILDAADSLAGSGETTDSKLVALAQHLSGAIVTNDVNLSKIAQLRGIPILNLHELAGALRPVVLPGESLKVRPVKPGEEPGQGVGYLDDGTMVVVEQGREHIGQELSITVTSVFQTSAGRMIFGRLEPLPPPRGNGTAVQLTDTPSR